MKAKPLILNVHTKWKNKDFNGSWQPQNRPSGISRFHEINQKLRRAAQSIEFREISRKKTMYRTKCEVFYTLFENWINNITILTTENCTGAIKNSIFKFHVERHLKLVPRLRADNVRSIYKYRQFQNGG